jgi:hypothetical protein
VAIVLSVFLGFTVSDYPFGIFKLFLPSDAPLMNSGVPEGHTPRTTQIMALANLKYQNTKKARDRTKINLNLALGHT